MSAEETVRRSLDAWNRDDREGHRAAFADDAVLHEHASGMTFTGADAIVEHHFEWRQIFPGMTGDVENVLVDGDQVAMETTWKGTHGGPLPMPDGTSVPASGARVELPAILVYRVEGDRIVEMRHYFNAVTMLAQVGALPAGAGA